MPTASSTMLGDSTEIQARSKQILSSEEQRAATKRILDRVRAQSGVPFSSEPAPVESATDKMVKMKSRSYRNRALFWLSQVGAFAEALMKGRHNKMMAVRAYEMVQSIV